MTSRSFRRLALWVGSERPTPRGPDEVLDSSPIEASGVEAKEVRDEIEDARFLWGFGDICPPTIQPGSTYRNGDKVRNGMCGGISDRMQRVCHELYSVNKLARGSKDRMR